MGGLYTAKENGCLSGGARYEWTGTNTSPQGKEMKRRWKKYFTMNPTIVGTKMLSAFEGGETETA